MGSKQSHGSLGRTDLRWYDPNDLTVVTDTKHPLFDERANMPINRMYVDSIKDSGVRVPVLARVNGQDDEGKTIVEIVEGRQRVRCSRVANEELLKDGKEPHRVPVILKKYDGNEAMDAMIDTNEIRTQDGPLVRARKLNRYMERGRSIRDAMVRFGIKSEATVKKLLALLDLDEEVQRQIDNGIVGVGLATKLALFPREQQVEQLHKIMAVSGALPETLPAPAGEPTNGTPTNGKSNGKPVDAFTQELRDLIGERVTNDDDDDTEEEGDKKPLPLDKHTAPANPPGKRAAKKAAKEQLKKQMGKRGKKIRARAVKTVAQMKAAREAIQGSRSVDAEAFDAALAWCLGIEDSLAGHKAIANRLEGV